jgi:hypothetical protein
MCPESHLQVARRWIQEDFSSDAQAILRLCLSDTGAEPLVFTHYVFAQRSAGLEDLPPAISADLHCGYLYLASYYFCVDAALDRHARSTTSGLEHLLPYLGHLLTGSISRFSRALERADPSLVPFFRSRLVEVLSENAEALKVEAAFAQQPLIPHVQEEFESIVGRANATHFLFELMWRLAGRTMPESLRHQLRRFTFVMQLGDDLGDWRDDFRARRWTSFLRECFARLEKIPQEDDLEDHIYVGGAYERRAVQVVAEFDDILANLDRVPGQTAVSTWIKAERDQAYHGLCDFVREKLSFGVTYA